MLRSGPLAAGDEVTADGDEQAPGILTASTLGVILQATDGRRHYERLEDDDEGAVGAKSTVATPYGDWALPVKRKGKQRQPVALGPPYQRHNIRRSDSNQSRNGPGHTGGAVVDQLRQARKPQCKRRVQLEPMRRQHPVSSVIREKRDKEAREASARLQGEIQWIHRHLPVLQLATTKNSRALRQQLLVKAIVHVATSFALRRSWRRWSDRVLQSKRDERRRLRASRAVMEKLIATSMASLARAFQRWREDMAECQEQEAFASAVTIQRWAHSVAREKRRQCEARSLAEALRRLEAHASAIQRSYRRYRCILRMHECQRAASRMQRVLRGQLMRRRRAREETAASTIQHAYHRFLTQRERTREAVARMVFEHGRTCRARTIQRSWRCYVLWKCFELPASCVTCLVDRVELVLAVQSIQRHIRRYQWRVRIEKRRQSGASCIQRSWRGATRRRRGREERRAVKLGREMAVRCLQRTYRRSREQRKVREVLKSSTRPLYLRILQVDDPEVRVRLHVEIARSAALVVQTAWRKHVAYVIFARHKRLNVAAVVITGFLRRSRRRCVWLRLVCHALDTSRRAQAPPKASIAIQRWFRRARDKASDVQQNPQRQRQQQSAIHMITTLMSAAVSIQRFHRRRMDPWRRVMLRVFHHERPKQAAAAARLQTWWRRELSRKRAADERKRSLTDLIKKRQQMQRRDMAARCVQRAYRRFLDRRNGRLLLRRYQILMRQELKKRQQRAVIHSFLKEEGYRRNHRQRKKNGGGGEPRTGSPIAGAKTIQSATSIEIRNEANPSADSAASLAVDTSASAYPVQEFDGRIRYWSEEYERAYLFDPTTGESTWL